ncbi:hypothetical protein CPter91_5234 [Collimonas pratensis]|uniref:Uncharacterized protein n=1 Tax=Collimonas pratensis TaxID=279113 RepID=A0A127QD18_9BURK|nr:hypothetical protein CPter91_5234 [Collimonas pratensis]
MHDRIPEKVEKPILAQRRRAGYAKKVCSVCRNRLYSPAAATDDFVR